MEGKILLVIMMSVYIKNNETLPQPNDLHWNNYVCFEKFLINLGYCHYSEILTHFNEKISEFDINKSLVWECLSMLEPYFPLRWQKCVFASDTKSRHWPNLLKHLHGQSKFICRPELSDCTIICLQLQCWDFCTEKNDQSLNAEYVVCGHVELVRCDIDQNFISR